jgi:putative lipoprotein
VNCVAYRQRIALPPDAVVQVQLQDTSRADAPAVVLGEQVIEPMGRQVPIPFSIVYDPAAINPRGRYTVRARIESAAGDLIWTSTQAYPVITGGNPTSDIEVVVQPVG